MKHKCGLYLLKVAPRFKIRYGYHSIVVDGEDKDWWKDELNSVIGEVNKILGKPSEYPEEIRLDSGLAFGYFAPNIYTFITSMKKEDRRRLSIAIMYHIDDMNKDSRTGKGHRDNPHLFDNSPSDLSDLELSLLITLMVMNGVENKKRMPGPHS